jgi:hypothetical protein
MLMTGFGPMSGLFRELLTDRWMRAIDRGWETAGTSVMSVAVERDDNERELIVLYIRDLFSAHLCRIPLAPDRSAWEVWTQCRRMWRSQL